MVLFPPCFLLLNPPLLRLPQGTGKGGYKAEFREFFLGAMEGRRSKKGRLEKVVGIQTLRFFLEKIIEISSVFWMVPMFVRLHEYRVNGCLNSFFCTFFVHSTYVSLCSSTRSCYHYGQFQPSMPSKLLNINLFWLNMLNHRWPVVKAVVSYLGWQYHPWNLELASENQCLEDSVDVLLGPDLFLGANC